MKRAIILATVILTGCENGSNDGKGGAGASGSTGSKATATTSSSTQTTGATMSTKQPFTAGSRLKVRTILSDDGAKQQLGFWDTELNLACNFAIASDGAPRCLPTDAPEAGAYFKDSECTVPVAVSTCATIPKYARITAIGCPIGTAIRQVSGSYPGPVYSRSLGTCGQAMLGMLSAFDLGPEVPASSWQQGTETFE